MPAVSVTMLLLRFLLLVTLPLVSCFYLDNGKIVIRGCHSRMVTLRADYRDSVKASFIEQKFDQMDNSMMRLVLNCTSAQGKYNSFMKEVYGDDIGGVEAWDLAYDIIVGIEKWSEALSKGYLPYKLDGNDDGIDFVTRSEEAITFPALRLCREIASTFTSLDLPSLTRNHPELVPSVVRALLHLITGYYTEMHRKQSNRIKEREDAMGKLTDGVIDWESYVDSPIEQEKNASGEKEAPKLSDAEEDEIIGTATRAFVVAWSPAVGSVNLLDSLYGRDHNLLSPQLSPASTVEEDLESYRTETRGYSQFDGIWRDSGWKVMRDLQKQVQEMDDLQNFLSQLGRRPTVKGRVFRKMPQQKQASRLTAPKGVAASKLIPSVLTDVRLSNTFEGLLPKELCLLLESPESNDSSSPESNDSSLSNSKSNNRKRLLFYAKLLQSELFSYENSGYSEEYSLPDRAKKHLIRLPTDRGGPVIICLDTSYSMTGFRETLAKAVVLQSSIVASRANRECYIIAFSGKSQSQNLMEYLVPLKLDEKGLARLLVFLAKSFKGGTDVTSPLTKALELMDTNPAFTNADVVLVTDGELQNPPIAPTLISKLKDLEIRSGLEVHGLLVGRNSSIPLDLLCTSLDGTNRVHTFLCKFDPIIGMYMQKATIEGVNSNSNEVDIESFDSTSSLKRMDMALKAIGKSSSSIPNRSITTQSTLRRSSYHPSRSTRLYMSTRSEGSLPAVTAELLVDSARVLANEAEDRKFHELYQDSLYTSLRMDGDDVYDSLLRVISILNEGLVERETEVRLLLLAVLSKEHLLLFGAPGTGKSELGRRLSRLTSVDSGTSSTKTSYFERLLTKFTQPEELFGPLSLKALEDDRYVRKTTGYLPTASVVFLDEIFKSSSSILNSLLTILNERRFSNGVDIEVVPLLTCIGASNEFPDSEELDALFDRFLIRKCVDTVSDDKITDLIKLADRSSARRIDEASDDSALLSGKMLATIDDRMNEGVSVPLEVVELIKKVRIFLREECDTSVSDRRLLKAIYALKVSAVSNGRKSVSLLDCLLLQHIFWSKADDRVKIEAFLWDNIVSDNRSVRFLLSNTLGSLQRDASNKHVYLSDLSPIIEVILKKLTSLKMLREEIKADESSHHDNDSRVASFRRQLLLDNETLQICRQKIAGRIGSSIKDLQRALVTALTAVQCVNSGPNGEEDFISLLSESLDLCDSSAAAGNGGREEVDGASGDEGEFLRDNNGFTAIELAYSSKEAKKKLSADDYKAWKKAQRSGTEKEKRGARIYNSNNVNDELE